MSDPQKYTIDESKVRKFYNNLIRTGRVSDVDLGSEDDFITKISGDPIRLNKVRTNLIGTGRFSEDDLGGSETDFSREFLKKNDAPLTSSKSSGTTQEKSLRSEETEELDNSDLNNHDYLNVTDYQEGGAAQLASDHKNSEIADAQAEELRKVVNKNMTQVTHDISNTIAKAVGWIKPSQAYTGAEGLLDRESDLKKHMDDLEKDIQEKHNPKNIRPLRIIARQQLALAFKDQFVADFNDHLKRDKTDLYTVLVKNPEYINEWRKNYRRDVPGEILDAAEAEIRSGLNNAVMQNENDKHIQPKVDGYMKRGYSEEEAFGLVQNEYEIEKDRHFRANMPKKTIERYEINQEMDRLYAEKPEGWQDDVLKLQKRQEAMGPTMFDENMNRIRMPEVEEEAENEAAINEQMADFRKYKSSKERFEFQYDEEFKVYLNLKRESEAAAKMYAEKVSQQQMNPGTLLRGLLGKEKEEAETLARQLDAQKVRVDALGRIVMANENIALKDKKEKGYYREVFVDAVRDANYAMFKQKTTEAEVVGESEAIMASLSEVLTEEELANVKPDLKEGLAESSGYMLDFVAKVAFAEATMGAAGIQTGVRSFNTGRKVASRIKAGQQTFASSRFQIKALNNLESFVIKAGMNEVRFGAAGADPGHGAAFHATETGLGKVIPMLLTRGNKHLATAVNAMARSPLTMTISMETVAAAQGSLHALANDKLVSQELHALFGDMTEFQKRIAIELMTGAMFGMGEVAKASKRGVFKSTPEWITELQELALKNGRTDVAAELGNMKYKMIESDWAGNEAKRLQKKVEYLVKEGVDAKELFISQKSGIKGTGNRARIGEINKQFEMRAGEDIALYDRVLGEGSLEAMQAKAKILKKAGVDIEGHSPGNIEVLYEQKMHTKKYGVKIMKQTELYEIGARRKELKTIEKSLKKESIGEGYTESTDAELAIRKSKQIERSEVEREFMKSYRRSRRDTSKDRLDYWKEKYNQNVREKWEGTEAESLTDQMIGTVDKAINIHKQSGAEKGIHIDKLNKAKQILEKSKKNKKALTNEQVDILTKRITDSRNAVTTIMTKNSINKEITPPEVKSDDRLDPGAVDSKTSFIMKVADMLFNRGQLEREFYGEKDQVKFERLQKRLDEFDMTKRQTEEMLKNRESEGQEGQDFTIYEAARDAMKNGATHQKALERRAALRKEAETRTLTEKEMLEYEMLNFVDSSKMSNYQLAEAHRAIKALKEHGKTEKAVHEEHQQLRDRYARYEAVKVIDPKAIDVNAKLIEPNGKALGKLAESWKSGRSWTESFPTMMEWLQSRTPGRKVLEGPLHNYTNRALQSGNNKAAAVGRHVKRMVDIETRLFGGPKEAQKKFKEWRKEYDFETMRNGLSAASERMSVQDALTIRAYAKQADQAITFKNRGWDIDSIKLLESQIEKFGGKEAMEWADAVVNEILPAVWSEVNSQYKLDIGADLSLIENYFPVVRKFEKGTSAGDPFRLHDDPIANIRSTHTSSSKERNPDAANWYRIKKPNDLAFNDLTYRHVDASMQYVHYQSLVKDMNSVFRNDDVVGVIENNFGSSTNQYISTMINDMARGRPGAESVPAFDKIRTRFIRHAIGVNPLLLPKQLMSFNAYQAEMSPAEAAKFLKYAATMDFAVMDGLSRSQDIKLRYETSQWNRDIALIDTQYGRESSGNSKRARIIRGKGLEAFRRENMKDNSMALTKYGDLAAILWGGQAMYRVRLETYQKKGYSAKEAQQRAYNDFINATRRTQQSGAVEDLSHVQKGTVGKFITQFKNAPLQYLRGERTAMTNMYEGVRQNDAAKFANGMKNFVLYHFILPQTFHAASNGFYINQDESWLDDPMTLAVAIGGSLSYYPIGGAFLESMISKQVTGDAFAPSIGVGEGIADDIWSVLEGGIEMMNEASDPGQFKFGQDDLFTGLNAIGLATGVATNWPINFYKGVSAFTSGETDDPRALGGYSEYSRGDYDRSDLWPIINKHSEKNGGTIDSMIEEYVGENKISDFEKIQARLEKEYIMYERFGGYDRHVNYAYSLKNSKQQSRYMYDLYKRRVEGKRPLRQNVSLKGMLEAAKMADPEFFDMVEEWAGYGVVSDQALDMFNTMVDEGFEEAYEY